MSPPVRLAVFYDGAWYFHFWRFVLYQSKWASPLSFAGVHDMLRWHLHVNVAPDVPVTEIGVIAHYVVGHHVMALDDMLAGEEVKIKRHRSRVMATNPRGRNIELAMIMYERARQGGYDIVALISGNADFVPLLTQVRRLGVRVMVPCYYPSSEDPPRAPITAPALAAVAHDSPKWEDLLGQALSPGYALHPPFSSPLPGRVSSSTPRG